jgi:hypothetical protein
MFKNKLDAEGLEYQRFLYFFEERPDVLQPNENEYELRIILTVCSSSWNTSNSNAIFAVLNISLALQTRTIKLLV